MLYLAPLQGFTDFTFRMVFLRHFGGIEACFIPYLSLQGGEVPKRELREILPGNNPSPVRTVPQVLVKAADELVSLATLLTTYGYREINLNLGCPYPMVTRRGRGAGLLPQPQEVKKILEAAFEIPEMEVSVKFRTGLQEESELPAILAVLNSFPLKEMIYHPRLASQLYKGTVNEALFRTVAENTPHRLIYNGDIFSVEDFRRKEQLLPPISGWMLGRGILMNPFLAEEICGTMTAPEEKRERLQAFHDELFEAYSERLAPSRQEIVKMQQFWSYFSFAFPDPRKTFKRIKKAKRREDYLAAVKINLESWSF